MNSDISNKDHRYDLRVKNNLNKNQRLMQCKMYDKRNFRNTIKYYCFGFDFFIPQKKTQMLSSSICAVQRPFGEILSMFLDGL